MSPEQVPTPDSFAPLSITVLEKGESLIAFCITCKTVLYKGGGNTRVSRRVMEDQIESRIAAFVLPHSVDVISTGL